MSRLIVILFMMALSLITATASAQDSATVSRDFVAGIFRRHADDSARLKEFRHFVDTCGDIRFAEDASHVFLEMTENDGSMLNLAYAYMFASYFSGNNDNYDKAIDLSFKGLEIVDSLQLNPVRTTLLQNISMYLSNIGDYDGAFQYIQKAQEVAEMDDDYENLVDIYYKIAISYIEQELYESAIQYFRKDISVIKRLGGDDTTEQELAIQSLRVKNALKIHDTIAAVALVDSINGLIGNATCIKDVSGLANYCVAMVESNLNVADIAPKRRSEYLGYCGRYLALLKGALDNSKLKWIEKATYNPCYARYMSACGDIDKAWSILRDTSNFISDENYNVAMFDFCKSRKDYKGAYDYFWRIYSNNFKKHSLESAIRYEKSESRAGYERRIAVLDDNAGEREKSFETSRRINHAVRHGILTGLVIIFAIIVVCLYYLRVRSRLNGLLKLSNDELIMANDELNTQRREILCQTDEIQHQSEIIKEQRDHLGSTNSQLMNSLSVARDIQTALMATTEKLGEALGENFIYWQPLNVVSGDFYWCAKIGGRAFLAVADCTGHGVPGALLSMYGISMLNDIVWRHSQSNAAEILDALKAAYVRSFAFDEEQYFLDGIDVAFIIFNRDSMTINYAGAKRPLIIVRNGMLKEVKPDKISIGHNPMRKNDTFTDHNIPIQNGDMVYAFSDGISDQFGYDDGVTKFGSRQLQNILTEMSFLDLPMQKKIIESSVDNWRIGAFMAGLTEIKAPQLDDHLLIGIRI